MTPTIGSWGILGRCAGKEYLPGFAAQGDVSPDINLLGVDVKPAQEVSVLLEQYPFINYKRHDEALRAIRTGEIQPPEVILIVTDSSTHVQVILDILDALPKDACVLILVEKPLDVSLRRIKRLLKRLKNFNGRVKIRCIDHYLLKPGFRALKRMLPELLPQIEPLRYVTFEMHEAGLVGAGLKNLINGGIIFDHPPHGWGMLNRLLSIEKFSLGTTVRARCAEAPDALPRDVETAAITPFHAITKWGEINGRVAVSKLTADDKQLVIAGDQGTIRLDIRGNEIDLLTNGQSTPIWGPQKARRASETLDAYSCPGHPVWAC